MKIAIHHRIPGFSEKWIKYCEQQNIEYKLVDCYANDIIKQIDDCDCLMWHHNNGDYTDTILAKPILFALEQGGKRVFPNFKSNWHFDDKIGQKYLLESIKAPLIPTYVFYSKHKALDWLAQTNLPKVFKLRSGSGARNVKLIRTKKDGVKLIERAFGKGFPYISPVDNLKERIRLFKEGKTDIKGILRALGKFLILPEHEKYFSNQKGYVYFQEFIPNNDSDVRLIVIGDKAYGMRRLVREGDFRASGSGNFSYEKIDDKTLEVAFTVSTKLGLDCVAFDFVYDELNNPLIVEMSYGFGTVGSSKCKGYWTKDLQWHEGPFNPEGWMVENLINTIRN